MILSSKFYLSHILTNCIEISSTVNQQPVSHINWEACKAPQHGCHNRDEVNEGGHGVDVTRRAGRADFNAATAH